MKNENSLGQKIIALNKKLGYTQEKLASKIGKSPVIISKIINKEHNPTLKTLKEISRALNVSVAFLLDGISEEASLKEQIEGRLKAQALKISNELIKDEISFKSWTVDASYIVEILGQMEYLAKKDL